MALLVYGLIANFLGRLLLLFVAFGESAGLGLLGLAFTALPVVLVVDLWQGGGHLKVLAWFCLLTWPLTYVYARVLRRAKTGWFPAGLLLAGDALFAVQGGIPTLKAALAGDFERVRELSHRTTSQEASDETVATGARVPIECNSELGVEGRSFNVRAAVRNSRTFPVVGARLVIAVYGVQVLDEPVGALAPGESKPVSRAGTLPSHIRAAKDQFTVDCFAQRAP